MLTQDIVSLVAPGIEGSLGIMANHAPLMAELTIGEVWMQDADGKEIRLAISGGFMEVNANAVSILADTAEKAQEIDIARAEEARKRAEKRLRTREMGIDQARAEASLKRALVRLHVARGE